MADEQNESAEAFLDHFSFVVSFLHREGFYSAEQTLLREFEAKYPTCSESRDESPTTVGPASESEPSKSDDSQPIASPAEAYEPEEHVKSSRSSGGGVKEQQAEPLTAQRLPGKEKAASNTGFNKQSKALHVASLAPAAPSFKQPKPKQIKPTHGLWETELDEYDTMDDVGYIRRDVSGQQQFVESELDLAEEAEGSERFFTHAPGSNTTNEGDEAADFEEDEDGASDNDSPSDGNDDEQGRSKSAAESEKTPGSSCHSTPKRGQQKERSSIDFAAAVSAPQDKTWDFGPMDIKLAEPVTTPASRSSVDREPRPVLSRVESLSSSFKDFDIERLDFEDLQSARNSQLDTCEMLTDAEVIDFLPPGSEMEYSPLDVDLHLEGFTSIRNSRSNSVTTKESPDDAALGWLASGGETKAVECGDSPKAATAAAAAGEEPGLALAGQQQQQLEPADLATRELGSGGGGFSFQFPVTPVVPPAVEPDARLFKSWPSVRSSSMSELTAGASDDENVHATEYADEDYRSRMSSREPSQTLLCLQPTSQAERGSGSSSTEATSPRALQTSTHEGAADDLLESPREISLDPAAMLRYKELHHQQRQQQQQDATPQAEGSMQQEEQELVDGAVLAAASSGASAADGGAPLDESTAPSPKADLVAHKIKISQEDMPDHECNSPRPSSERPSSEPGPSASPMLTGGESSGPNVGRSISSVDEGPTATARAELSMSWEEVGGAAPDGEAPPSPAVSNADGASGSSLLAKASSDAEAVGPSYTVDDNGVLMYEYDTNYIERKYEVFDLRIIHRSNRTGFEETKDFPIRMNDLIAGRYQVMDFLGSAAFSRAVQALDVKTGSLVCLKIIKNNKDYFDQSLDEIKLLKYVNSRDPADEHGLVRLYDYFYYKEHLFLVCELLRANLYEFQKYNRESNDEPYFSNARIQRIAISVLRSLAFMHSLGLIHSDLKPENILIKSYSRCEVKVIDLGSSCFVTDQLSSYVQSRSYRAPEVILGLPYDQKVDIWSLGCILAELSSGYVLFQNDSLSTLLARLEGILGPMPDWMIQRGRYSNRFYTRSGHVYERSATTERYELLMPKRSGLRHRMPEADEGLLGFVSFLLGADPRMRPTAMEALMHPWLQHVYPSLDSN